MGRSNTLLAVVGVCIASGILIYRAPGAQAHDARMMASYTALMTDAANRDVAVAARQQPAGAGSFGGHGKGDADAFRVIVRDSTEPNIISVTPSASVLPDTNQSVPVSIAVVVSDLVDPAPVCQISRVAGQGNEIDHDAVIDWTITGNLTLNISANTRKRQDRTYTITVQCTDASGNSAKETTAIVISQEP